MSASLGLGALPRAHGGAAGKARLRAAPEDFVVREWLGFAADGEGEHLLLRVRKRGANTMWVARQLARQAQIHPRDVGFAGLKDRDAVAEQAFTVPARSAIGLAWEGVKGEGYEVLSAERTRRKLKRGALRGNDFEIVLRDFTGDPALLEQRLQAMAVAGVPSWFGPQRFGRAGSNLRLAREWFAGQAEPHERAQRGFALSAARAAIFNAVLARRVSDGTWDRLQPGEIVNLDGSGSIFVAEAIDETLQERCRRLDVHPTGPLWGAVSRDEPTAGTAALEHDVAQRESLLAEGLVRAGLQAERRALRAPVRELQWTIDACDVRMSFRLQRGCFATAVLHELIENAFDTQVPESEE